MDEVHDYVQQLHWCLQWNPLQDGENNEQKSAFIEALTEIAALPSDTMSMEARRLLVERSKSTLVDNMVQALGCRDVLLKCKAANAIGSICMSRVAGQQLLDQFGDALMQKLVKMATCKNQWAIGDAYFVIGWLIVIGDEAIVKKIERLLPSVMKQLHKNLMQLTTCTTTVTHGEQASNFRIYSLVLLLNFCQKDANAFVPLVETVIETMQLLLQLLVRHLTTTIQVLEADEGDELLRLVIAFLSLLANQLHESVPSKLRASQDMVDALRQLEEAMPSRQARQQSAQAAETMGTDEMESLLQHVRLLRSMIR